MANNRIRVGRAILLGVLTAACAAGFGQDDQGGLKKHTTKILPATSAPVTESEARAVFAKSELAMRQALVMNRATPAVSIPDGSAPVRREQVIAEMARIYNFIRPKIKLTPSPVKYDASVLRIDSKEAGDLKMFVRIGAVARVGPLAVGPKDSLTVPEFGDAIGFFLARMAEMTHMPSNKWTPELQPQAGGG